jgi:hypothetical protein
MLTKTFKLRSSATEVLRQLGVNQRDYNLFIEPADGGVTCKIELAQQHVATIAKQTGATHDADLKVTPKAKRKAAAAAEAGRGQSAKDVPEAVRRPRYTVNTKKLKYHETARGVQALAVIDADGKSFCHFDDYPEQIVAEVHFANDTDRRQFLADARKAGFAEAGDDHAISEYARKLVHDAEARMLAEAEAQRKATKAKPQPANFAFPQAPKIEAPSKAKKEPEKAPAKPAKGKATPKSTEAPKAAKENKRTVTSVARELIVAGKTNDEVWAALVKEFKLDDGKKSYPAWYRRDCKKRGLIS